MKEHQSVKILSVVCGLLFLSLWVKAQTPVSSVDKTISQMSLEEKVSILLNQSEKYAIRFADASCGVALYSSEEPNKLSATAFPVPFVLASSWNKELAMRVGMAVAREAAGKGVNVVFAPSLNLIRNPLSGNIWDCYSEDPVLAGCMAYAFQNGLHSQKIPFCIRYFGLNNQEKWCVNLNLLIDQRTLKEFYLYPFEKVCNGQPQPWGILAACPHINGKPVAESKALVYDLLRVAWKYDGLVLAEAYGGEHVANMLHAGTDWILKSGAGQKDSLIRAVRDSLLSEEEIDAHLRRFLMARQSMTGKSARNEENGHSLAVEAAAESVVMLKNLDAALPLASTVKKVAFFGVSSYRFIQTPNCTAETGAYRVQASQHPSLVNLFLQAGYATDQALVNAYLNHLKTYLPEEKKEEKPQTPMKSGNATPTPAKNGTVTPANRPKPLSGEEKMKVDLKKVAAIPCDQPLAEMRVSKSTALQYVKTTQAGIILIGHHRQAGQDRTLENGYRLSEEERELIRQVCAAYHTWGKKVIVVLNTDGPVEMTDWQEYPDAILFCGLSGQGGAEALMKIITGKISPSGKLNMVYAKSYEDYPSADFVPHGDVAAHKIGSEEMVEEINYGERFRNGYRYFDEHQGKVLYPFGFGLSYTTFAYDKMSMQRKGDSVLVSVRVTNTGKVTGKEVVQLYVSPQRKNLKIERPLKELKDFAKTSWLKAGESQQLTLRFSIDDLSVFDDSRDCRITYAGNYTLKLGSSSQEIQLQYPLQLTEDKIIANIF